MIYRNFSLGTFWQVTSGVETSTMGVISAVDGCKEEEEEETAVVVAVAVAEAEAEAVREEEENFPSFTNEDTS